MVTISRIRTKRFFIASIRWKILLAFFVIVGVSFAVAATNLTGLVRDYLFEQRTREDSLLTEKAAAAAAPFFAAASPEDINRVLAENAQAMDGRLMLIDQDGKVQYDTLREMSGRRLQMDEVLRVLTGSAEQAYGIHAPGETEAAGMGGGEYNGELAYSVHAMDGEDGQIGALLFVSRIQSLMDSISSVQWQLISIFVLIALAALMLALFLSQILTKPITNLSRSMRKMGKGDLSVRVPEKGSGELRELAENYNTMAAQLERLDKTRNQFVSNASHELKTPLTTMKIMLETVMYQPDMPEELRREFMEDMNHEIDRLTGIVTDLLTLTRVDSDKSGMKQEPVNMSALTEEVIRLLAPAAEKRGQHLECSIDPGLQMMGDRARLNQILYNLTDNAIKYSPDGGRIFVSLHTEGEGLVWRVRDNGVGIPPEDQEHIFERFYRVDKARSRDTGGTGLGLSIVKQLVTMHGGEITVNSALNQGSEFKVVFPQGGAAS